MMLNGVIKTEEQLPLWKQTPKSMKKVKLAILPDYHPKRQMTIEEYFEKINESGPNDDSDVRSVLSKKIVLSEIEKLPEIWKCNSSVQKHKFYPQVALGVYRRNGKILTLAQIRSIFKVARDTLRTKLREGICRKGLNITQLEEYLWKWDLYPYIRFQREMTQKWEKQARQKMTRDEQGNHIMFDVPDDEPSDHEDIDVEEVRRDANIVIADDVPEAVAEEILHHSPPPENDFRLNALIKPEHYNRRAHQSPPRHYEAVENYEDIQVERLPPAKPLVTHSLGDTPKASKRRRASLPAEAGMEGYLEPTFVEGDQEFNSDLSQIFEQATRIVRRSPNRTYDLRRALFDVVIEFDRYDNLEDLFENLSLRNSRNLSRLRNESSNSNDSSIASQTPRSTDS